MASVVSAEPASSDVPAQETAEELTGRLRVVRAQGGDIAAVRAPAEQAELALRRAGDAKLDEAARARALAIARAAVALAEARVTLAAERNLKARALARLQDVSRRAAAARADAGAP